MKAPKTNFEQISIEKVMTIAKRFPEEEAIESDSNRTEKQEEVRSPRESWREVAQKVQQEQDPRRMTELAKQLIAALDEEVKFRRG